jgi:hypothetical protein
METHGESSLSPCDARCLGVGADTGRIAELRDLRGSVLKSAASVISRAGQEHPLVDAVFLQQLPERAPFFAGPSRRLRHIAPGFRERA